MDLMNIVINAANAQAAYDEQQRLSMIISIGIGLCGGLSVAFLGLVKRQGWLGAIGLVVCLIGGYFGGWILVIPLSGGLSAVINEQAKRQDAQELAARQYEEGRRQEHAEAARRAEATRKAAAASSIQPQSNQPDRSAATSVRRAAAPRTSQVVAVRWSDRLNDPQVQLNNHRLKPVGLSQRLKVGIRATRRVHPSVLKSSFGSAAKWCSR